MRPREDADTDDPGSGVHATGLSDRLAGLPLRWRLWALYVTLLVAVLAAVGVVLDRLIDRLLIDATVERTAQQVATVAQRSAGPFGVSVPGVPLSLPREAGLGHSTRAVQVPPEERPEFSPPPGAQPKPPAGAPGERPPLPPPGGGPPLPDQMRLAHAIVEALNGPEAHVAVYGADRQPALVGATGDDGPPPLVPTAAEIEQALVGRPAVRVAADRSPRLALAVLPIQEARFGTFAIAVVATSLAAADATLDAIRWALLAAGVVATLGGGAVGVPLTRRLLGPMERLSATADRVAAGDLSARAGLRPSGDEVGRLGRAFDAMLERLQATLEAQRRFVADASHELKSPLTGLGGMVEVLREVDPDEDSRRRALNAMAREVERTNGLVADLLLLSRLDGRGELVVARETVDLAELVEQEAETRRVLGRPIESVVAARPIVPGDRPALARMLRNLVDNAINATADGEQVVVRLDEREGWAVLSVRDEGVGIAASALPHLFERFYRADAARARRGGGSGLGLSIARSIVAAHDGDVVAESEGPGRGATFTVRLPTGPVASA